MKSKFLALLACLLPVVVFAQSSTLTINPTTGRINVPANSATPNFAKFALPRSVYLFPTFITSEERLRIAWSSDGTHWGTISDSPLFDPGGSDNLRDPQMWIRNGVYYVAFTTGNFGFCNYWKICSSTDLLNWTAHATVSMSAVTGANQVWMGPFYVDPSTGLEYVFTSVSTNQVSAGGAYTSSAIYAQTPTVPGVYTAWNAPVAVTGTSLPTKVIAQRVVKVGSSYRFFTKNDTTGNAHIWASTSLLSGYTVGSAVSEWGTIYEGVGLVSLGGNSWRAVMDKFPGMGMYYSDSADNFATWSAPAAVTSPETYSNSDALLTNDSKVLVDVLSAESSNRLVSTSSPRFAGLYIGEGTASFNPVHFKAPFGAAGSYTFDTQTGVQMNLNLARGGTNFNAFIIDGGLDLKLLSWPLADFITHWSNTDGTLRQLKGDVTIEQIGKGLKVKEGSNARMGTATMVSGTVTVSNTSVTANTRVFLSRVTKNASTAIGSLEVGTITASTSFVVNALKADATTETNDVSTVHWLLVEPSP